MNFRFCHRCQAELPPHDEGTLIFCSHCGVPQVLLSEELLSQVEMQSTVPTGTDAVAVLHDPRSIVWSGAIRCAGLAGAIATGLMCISVAVPPMLLITILWAVVSPVVVLGLFQSRFPMAPLSASFGARLGLLTGISVASVIGIVSTLALVFARFRLHAMSDFDKQWAVQIDQQARVLAQSGADAALFLKMSAIPEFRAGMVLGGMALGIFILLVVTTAGGAFAGFVRSRPRA